jgi:deazaflavin-dependent oxidoreductase (nitroreductase family)
MTEPTNAAWRALIARHAEEFRANQGTVSGRFRDQNLLLLTTTGARTGELRMVVLVYFLLEGRMIVAGSKGGASHHPGWVHNLRATPRAHVEVGSTSYDVAARELPAEERLRAYREIVRREPRFGDYQAKTSRTIPLFELRRVGATRTRC